jgi:zinc protease
LALLAALIFANLPARASGPVWPQVSSDVPADPSVLFGVLPNGMRYAIKKNTTPAHQVSLRLRIAAGSIDETDSEQGIAHFLEHLAFRGSRNFPDGAAIKTLESLGLSFGADLNAATYPDRTVYKFDLPAGDDAVIGKGLLLTRDIASELTLDSRAIDSERGVVLSEARQRDIAAYHLIRANLAAVLGARFAEAMLPIGKPAVIQAANAEQIRKFYVSHYRPERAVLIVVGDIDPPAIEARIKTLFSDWHDAAPLPPSPVYSVPGATAPHFTLFSEPGANAIVDINWVMPHDTTPDSIARETRDTIRAIGLKVLDDRFQKLARSAAPPFIAAGAAHVAANNFADLTSVSAAYPPGGALHALEAVHDVYRDVLENGIKPDELDQAVRAWRAEYEAAASAANSTPSPRLANGLVGAIDDNSVITAPAEDLALFESAVKTLSPDRVATELRALFPPGGPNVMIAGPEPLEGGEAAAAASYAKMPDSQMLATSNPAESGAKPWPYGDFGPAGKVVAEKTVDDLGVTLVAFANGVSAVIKPTKFRGGQILVSARFGNGLMALPRDAKSPGWALRYAFVVGGLGKIGVSEMEKTLSGKVLGASISVGTDAFVLAGTTRPDDYTTQLQELAAYLADPAWRPEAFAQARSAMLQLLTQSQSTPDGVFGLYGAAIQHNGDPRYASPTPEDVRAAQHESVKTLLRDALAGSPVEVDVVGDISVDDAVRGLQATFGALPQRTVRMAPLVGDEQSPAAPAAPIVLRHQGGKDQALAYLSWPTTGLFPDHALARKLRVLQLVIEQRLIDELRTREGIAYTPQSVTVASPCSPAFGYVAAFADVPPAKIPDFYAAIANIAGDLKTNPVSDQELERARTPRIDDLQQEQQTNAYWLQMLGGASADPRKFDIIRSTIPDLQRVTAADLQTVAQTYLVDGKALKIVVVPQDWDVASLDR